MRSVSPRKPNWRSLLTAYIESVRRANFAYGSTDCACYVSGGVEAITGDDPMAGWRGRYASVRGARKLLKEAGVASLGDLAASIFEEINPAFAGRGDIGLIETDGPFRAALCIVDGERVMVMTPLGVDSLDRRHMVRAFRV